MAAEPAGFGRLGVAARAFGMLCALGFIVLLGYGVLTQSPDTTIDDALTAKRAPAAPGFALAVLTSGVPGDGLQSVWRAAARDGSVDLRELRGVPVVLNVWASWCIPCREEAALLQRGWESARRQGVLFVGLNQQDARNDAMTFIREFRQDYPNVRDPSNQTSRRWGVAGIPETFFITARGDIVSHVIGTVSAEQLRDGVAAARRSQALGAQDGGEQRPTR